MRRRSFLPLALGLLATACRPAAKLEKPMELYQELESNQASIIYIPIRVDVAELENSINRQVQGLIYEDNDLKDGDNMMLRAVKRDPIKVAIDSQMIQYQIPLALWIKYDAGITTVEGTGDILLDMRTVFSVKPDWSLYTQTELVRHQWLQQPRVRLGVVNLPIGMIANVALRGSRRYFNRTIDEQVRQNFQLETLVQDLWRQMYDPLLLSEEYNTWLIVNPSRIAMSPLKAEKGVLSSSIVVETFPYLRVGAKPPSLPTRPLPPFQMTEASGEDFILFVNAEITYEEAERIAKNELVGETYTHGRRAVTVRDVSIYASGENLVVNTVLMGSYNGSIYLEGEPVYNERSNAIEVKNLRFTLGTRNFLHKSAGWLLKSAIRRQIQQNLNFLLDYNLADMKTELQNQLKHFQFMEGITMQGELADLNVRRVRLMKDGMIVQLGLAGKVDVQVKGFN
jgi:hypothetical protein